jgi:hypothetical protein
MVLRKVDQKYLESFEMWCWRTISKISLTDPVRNEKVLQRVKEEWNNPQKIQIRKANGIGHMLRRNCLLERVIEEKIGKERSDRKVRKKT